MRSEKQVFAVLSSFSTDTHHTFIPVRAASGCRKGEEGSPGSSRVGISDQAGHL